MAEDERDGDAERLMLNRIIHADHDADCPCEGCVLIRLLDARDAALREKDAEIERLRAELNPSTREHVATRPVLAISPEDLIYRLRQHVRNRGAPHLPNGAWALMLEAANQLESDLAAIARAGHAQPESATSEGEDGQDTH